jgi:hypothetical protein
MVTTIWSGLTIKSILDDTGFSYIWNIQQNVDLMSIKIVLPVHPKITFWYKYKVSRGNYTHIWNKEFIL